jgi:hypothetical protein
MKGNLNSIGYDAMDVFFIESDPSQNKNQEKLVSKATVTLMSVLLDS